MVNSSSPGSRHCYQLEGSVTIAACSQTNGRPTICRKAGMTLGRNAERDIVLEVGLGGKRSLSYLLADVSVHSAFVKEGKGSIRIPSKDVQILLSNCPPERLRIFLKTLSAKLRLIKRPTRTPLGIRNFVSLPRIASGLSPLSIAEIRQLRPDLVSPKPGAKKTPKAVQNRAAKSPASATPKARAKARKVRSTFGLHPEELLSLPAEDQIAVDVGPSVSLNPEQKAVIAAVLSGESVFFTGPAGTGKSLLLRNLLGRLPPDSTVVTAATGVAACQIGGTTLHSFAGVGTGTGSLDQCIRLASRPHIASGWRRARVLIVDEVSMVDGGFFERLESVARVVRNKADKPFGGLQLLLCGDFLQLPPVARDPKQRTFAFQTKAWRRCVQRCISLTRIHRQADPVFAALLCQLRLGRCDAEATRMLRGTSEQASQSSDGILCTRLCTHKAQAASLNTAALARLPGSEVEFVGVDSDGLAATPASEELLAPQSIVLKVGAQVMLTRNLELGSGLANGARGVVIGFGDGVRDKRSPRVRFADGQSRLVPACRFTSRQATGMELWRIQIPLQLAWAISIHKSQGMSLTRVEVSLGDVFEEGQAYVGLSRATSLQGLRVLDFHPSVVRANSAVLAFYDGLEALPAQSQPPDISVPFKRSRLSDQF